MAALQSFRFVSPSAVSAAISACARPPSTLASVPAGRRERCFPGLALRHHRSGALRPCVVVRAAQSSGGAGQPAADRYFVEERKQVMKRHREIVCIDHGCLGTVMWLASISHILLDAALEALAHLHQRVSLSEYAFNRDVEGMRDEFNRQMDDLEDAISKASPVEIGKLAIPGILEGMEITSSFVGLVVARRKRALGKAAQSEVVV